MWDRKLAFGKMLRQIDESVVFVAACTNHTDDRLTVQIRQAEIGAVAASTRKLLNVGGFSTFPLLI